MNQSSSSEVSPLSPQAPLIHITSTTTITIVTQRCTDPGRQVAVATKPCTVAPNICGSPVWNLLHVTILAPRILTYSLAFGKAVQRLAVRELENILSHQKT
jgi:hypothetical protein